MRNINSFLNSHPNIYQAFELDREFRMAKLIQSLLGNTHITGTILDVGCGLGNEAAYLASNGYKVVGIDKSAEMISWALNHYKIPVFKIAEQKYFQFKQQFDAIYSVGSTFLYNLSNDEAICTLNNFRKHLRKGGLLHLDVRNGMFFFTAEGQRWLSEEMIQSVLYQGKTIQLKVQFSLDLDHQQLLRDYCWSVDGRLQQCEHLKHRLLFPNEIELLLSAAQFKTLKIFGTPAPSSPNFLPAEKDFFDGQLTNQRMQILAEAT